jgi:hypothetical protein
VDVCVLRLEGGVWKMMMDEKFIRRAVINYLSKIGYDRRLREKETHEHGLDIKVRHNQYPRYFLVEVKGDPDIKKVKHLHSRREVSFVYALGQIVSRMGYKAKYKYGLGFPEGYFNKIKTRMSPILLKKLNLYVFLVNEKGKVKEINWRNFNKI